ncbi:hypothetical protein G4Y73_00955 [Wenzhouxiangella sp. XN201]|uniref:hypothetical protein n=1 Tax=Wenzhouxiangella sp. XN201 TaxID=2710755 RepID=UPI0013C8A481|nr:hypothetical protein [Wenzhouxiangella sp. XN201]NEZ02713.1 hypothetical protein [Wenzhouxiangella sp. XN201]
MVAGPVRVVVDGERLDQLSVEAVFGLPDGTQQTWQALLAGCFPQQGAGLLVYDPDLGNCLPFDQALPSEWPDAFDLEAGVVIFDTLTRETCLPGECVVTVGGAPAGGDPGPGPGEPPDPIFADDFELLVPQS